MIFQMKKKKKETQCYSRTEKIKYRFVFRQTTKPQLLHSKWNELHINTKWEMVVRLTPWKIFSKYKRENCCFCQRFSLANWKFYFVEERRESRFHYTNLIIVRIYIYFDNLYSHLLNNCFLSFNLFVFYEFIFFLVDIFTLVPLICDWRN